ncbi:MAG: RrF2 family transcriptional regulator [Oscillospiraceae bacterium]|nr:RrF2 family transcriptional regulator [Oscillospiraceae bacterium]
MMISTRGRYALRVMIDLAEHQNGGYIPMKDVAERQEISLKYIERIMPVLTRSGCVEGVHGKGGGYRLTRAPEDYTAGEILRLAEGDLSPVACLQEGAKPCPRAAECRTLPMWREFHALTRRYFDGITLADLMATPLADNYVI